MHLLRVCRSEGFREITQYFIQALWDPEEVHSRELFEYIIYECEVEATLFGDALPESGSQSTNRIPNLPIFLHDEERCLNSSWVGVQEPEEWKWVDEPIHAQRTDALAYQSQSQSCHLCSIRILFQNFAAILGEGLTGLVRHQHLDHEPTTLQGTHVGQASLRILVQCVDTGAMTYQLPNRRLHTPEEPTLTWRQQAIIFNPINMTLSFNSNITLMRT